MKNNPNFPKYHNLLLFTMFFIKTLNHQSLTTGGGWWGSPPSIVTTTWELNISHEECKILHPPRNLNHLFSPALSLHVNLNFLFPFVIIHSMCSHATHDHSHLFSATS
jgi:hypothetical protein